MEEFAKEFVKDNPIVTRPFSDEYSKMRETILEAELNFDKISKEFYYKKVIELAEETYKNKKAL